MPSKKETSSKSSISNNKDSKKSGSNSKNNSKQVITMALPYANGPLHIGHLLGFIQADIYSRYLKLKNQDAIFVCASDMHGTPITINAKKNNQTPINYANKYYKEHQIDFKKFQVEFDNFHKTHSKENKELSLVFFNTLKKQQLIYTKTIEQLYDKKAKQFLPDRFVKGECPKCNEKDQYGDNCEKCGTTYEPTDLKNPYSTITNTKPVLKETTHYYFKLSKFQKKLDKYINSKKADLQKEVKHFAENWVKEGLNDWCISRDDPYFGFEIPGSKQETGAKKYLYVWLDAPIGYISSTKNYCDKQKDNQSWQDYWQNNNTNPIHFIGKDIMYFHLLFWPAMLGEMNINLPKVNVNGFITVDGQKMSKSRGTFFTASDFHNKYGSDQLRFYFASHSDKSIKDINLSLNDFQAVSNNVLLASLGNFCYRTLSFTAKHTKTSKLPAPANKSEEKQINKQVKSLIKEIDTAYNSNNLKQATNKIIQISDLGNVYFQNAAPWKEKTLTKETLEKLSFTTNLAKTLAILIKPILPNLSKKIETTLNLKSQTWNELNTQIKNVNIKQPEKLLTKIEIKENKLANEAEENQFPVEIKAGQIIKVNDHKAADKLYILKVDFKTEQRQIIAGIKEKYTKKELLNKKALFITNLEAAKIRGETSNGMTLVAEEKDKSFQLIELPKDTKLGTIATFKSSKKDSKINQINFKQWQKLKLTIKDKKITYEGQVLKLNKKEVVINAKDGARIR